VGPDVIHAAETHVLSCVFFADRTSRQRILQRLPQHTMFAVRVRPRVEINKWSLYHHSTVATQTISLDDLVVATAPTATVSEFAKTAWSLVEGHKGHNSSVDCGLGIEHKIIRNGLQLCGLKSLQDYEIDSLSEVVLIKQVFVVEGEFPSRFRIENLTVTI